MLVRQLKILAFAIIISLFVIFGAGIFVSGNNINPELHYLNLITLIGCSFFCVASLFIRRSMMKKITLENFFTKYFSTQVISYALCEFGGIFCLTTNLFVNQNILFASAGFGITALYVYLNFPKERDFGDFKGVKNVTAKNAK